MTNFRRYPLTAAATLIASVSSAAIARAETVVAPGLSPQVAASPSATQGTGVPPAGDPVDADTGGEDIVIIGSIRRSLEAAADIKREAVQVVDSIVAEDIGKFPDPTTAAALQRVPGVQVEVGGNNEIVGVRIRGLTDILTTLDGREFFSTTGRSFEYQDLPAEALARVDVYKTSTANLIEGGIAGITDLQLNKPFNFRRPTVVAFARGNYALNPDRLNPQLSLLATNTWNTGAGEIGALVNVSWSRNVYDRPYLYAPVRRSTATAPFNLPGLVSQNVTGGLNEYGSFERPQANAAIQWQVTPDLQLYADGLYTGYRSDQQSAFIEAQLFNAGTGISDITVGDRCFRARVNAAGFNPTRPQINAGQFTVQDLCEIDTATFSNATAFASSQARRQRTDNYLLGGGLVFERGPGRVKVDVAYQTSTFTNEAFIVDIGKRLPQVVMESNTPLGGRYTFTGNPMNDPAGLVFRNGLNQNFNRSEGSLLQARIDGSFDVGGLLSQIQYGIRFADREARFDQALVNRAVPGGDIGTPREAFATPIASVGLPANFLVAAPGIPNLNGGASWLTPDPDYLRSDAGRDVIRTIFGLPTGDPAYQRERRFDARERTMAGYLQMVYDIGLTDAINIDGTVGVRPTLTDRRIEGAGLVSGTIVSQVGTSSDTDILPNGSARIRFGGGLQARLTYSKAIRRPGFGALNPGISYVIASNVNVQNTGSAGNPELRPQISDSYDATLEYYFDGGFIAVAGYYRDIRDRVISSPNLETIDGIGYNITRPRNVGEARLQGVEVSGQAFFEFLPGVLRGLGAQANFTFADSEVRGNDPLAGFPLLGVSRYNFNAGLLYELFGISGRVIYTFRSRFYDQDTTNLNIVRPITDAELAAGINPTNLSYVRPAGRLDFSVGYDLNEAVRIDVGGSNVLRNKFQSYFEEPGFNRDIRWDDTIYTVGLRVRL